MRKIIKLLLLDWKETHWKKSRQNAHLHCTSKTTYKSKYNFRKCRKQWTWLDLLERNLLEKISSKCRGTLIRATTYKFRLSFRKCPKQLTWLENVKKARQNAHVNCAFQSNNLHIQKIDRTGFTGKKLNWKKSRQNAHVHRAFQSKRSAGQPARAVRSKLEWLSIWKLATSTAKVLSWLLYLLCKVYLCKKMWFKSVLPGRKKDTHPTKKKLKVRILHVFT